MLRFEWACLSFEDLSLFVRSFLTSLLLRIVHLHVFLGLFSLAVTRLISSARWDGRDF